MFCSATMGRMYGGAALEVSRGAIHTLHPVEIDTLSRDQLFGLSTQ